MIAWVLGIVAVIAILVTWFFIPGKPLPNSLGTPDGLAKALEYLRNRGIEGGELRIQARADSRMSAIVVKHIVQPNNIELRGTVTDEAMLHGGYEAVEAALAARGIAYEEGDVDGRRALMLRVSGSLADLEVFLESAMELGFGKTVSSDCDAYYKNVLVWNMPSATGVGARQR